MICNDVGLAHCSRLHKVPCDLVFGTLQPKEKAQHVGAATPGALDIVVFMIMTSPRRCGWQENFSGSLVPHTVRGNIANMFATEEACPSCSETCGVVNGCWRLPTQMCGRNGGGGR